MGNEVSEPQRRPSGSSSRANKQYTFKIVVLGDRGTGKTALINRVVHGLYTGKERPTTGVEFALCSLNDFATSVGGDRTAIRRDNVRLMLWDVGGQEKFGGKTRFYYEHAVAGIVVADATKPKTIKEAEAWVTDLRAKVANKGPNGENMSVPVIMFVNKVDQVSPKQLSALTPSLKEFVRSNDIMGFWTCSAKEDANLNKPVQMLVTKLLEQRHSDEIKLERSEGYSYKNWQPLELATHCAACQTEFSLFTWKHHCRSCGLIYCGNCTPHAVALRDKGYTTPVKICINCHHALVTAAKQKSSSSSTTTTSSSSSSLSSSSSSSSVSRSAKRPT